MHVQRRAMIAVVLVGLMPAPSHAATYFGSAHAGGLAPENNSGSAAAPVSYFAGSSFGSAAARTWSERGGSVRTDAVTTGSGNYSYSIAHFADASLSYTIQLVGPSAQAVPVRVVANGYATGSGVFGASAHFNVSGSGGRAFGEAEAGGPFTFREFAVDTIVNFVANSDYTVSLVVASTTGFVSSFGSYSGTATAFVDPVFTIDPAYAPLYTLVGVPGSGDGSGDPGPGVPEPASWALMIAGFGLVGGVLRRRQVSRTLRLVEPAFCPRHHSGEDDSTERPTHHPAAAAHARRHGDACDGIADAARLCPSRLRFCGFPRAVAGHRDRRGRTALPASPA